MLMSKAQKRKEIERYAKENPLPGGNPEGPAPAMPVTAPDFSHREKWPEFVYPYDIAVARPVGSAEIRREPEAKAAVDKEWENLRSRVTWEESKGREWSDVSREARSRNETIHIGRIAELCTEKGSELPKGHPGRKFKGRAVFLGNQVKDQDYRAAVFADLGSNPASMTSVSVCDAVGLQPGFCITTSDARQAYLNAVLKGPKTWIRLPPHRIPKEYASYKDVVFPLRLGLYGHPDAGTWWEEHSHEILTGLGWRLVDRAVWKSTYKHDQHDALLIVYVDDFRVAAPRRKTAALWKEIKAKIDMSEPEESAKFLGCDCKVSSREFPVGGAPWADYTPAELAEAARKGQLVRAQVTEYDMQAFFESCVDRYCEEGHVQRAKLPFADTPFLDEKTAEDAFVAKRAAAEAAGKTPEADGELAA